MHQRAALLCNATAQIRGGAPAPTQLRFAGAPPPEYQRRLPEILRGERYTLPVWGRWPTCWFGGRYGTLEV